LKTTMRQVDPTQWLAEPGDALFAYALRRVRSRELAEDLVQETLLAAIRQVGSFDGRSAVRTWLTGILRHKLIDSLRRAKVRKAESLGEADTAWSFTPAGGWAGKPTDFGADPASQADNSELGRIIDGCGSKLPPQLRTAFLLRDVDGLSVEEACHSLAISANHLAVRLYRARLLLRACIERYLAEGAEP
jgi:RNA polymerase sigma-70 factor (ECF subfamily)